MCKFVYFLCEVFTIWNIREFTYKKHIFAQIQKRSDFLTKYIDERGEYFDDLDFSFDDFEIDLDIDLSFDDFDFDFLNEQKNEQRANKEKMQKLTVSELWERSTSEAREKQNLPKTKPRGSQEEAVRNPLEAVRKRWVFGVFGVHKKRNEARRNFEYFPTIKKRFSPL